MKNKMRLILMIFAISFLTSCASSNGVVLPKMIPGDEKTFTINQEGTMEILGQSMRTLPKHWLYIHCDHWSGCYMRCQGEINSCKKVARDSEFSVDYIFFR